jgi:hypothetical protein
MFFLASVSFFGFSGTNLCSAGMAAALAAMPVTPLALGVSGYSYGTLKL